VRLRQGFLCPLCNNRDLGSLKSLQAHYDAEHAEPDEAPMLSQNRDEEDVLSPRALISPPLQPEPPLQQEQQEQQWEQDFRAKLQAAEEECGALKTQLTAAQQSAADLQTQLTAAHQSAADQNQANTAVLHTLVYCEVTDMCGCVE
jgi:hypothetical protein